MVLMCLFLSSVVYAEDSFQARFVEGEYLLIGQEIDSDETYQGRVSIYLESDQLIVKRTINDKVVMGDARFETALNGDASVLRIRFTDNGVKHETTCLLRSDLDNYARISCYLYYPDQDITKPGLEALFIDHSNS